MINAVSTPLSPLIKWAGGKEQELKYITPNMPCCFDRYFEPFVGGGALFTHLNRGRSYINDRSSELISLYKIISSERRNEFFDALAAIVHNWNLITSIVARNSDFFISIYADYSEDKSSDQHTKDLLFEFILSHSAEFNGMFSTHFNYNIENFIDEIKLNIVRKTKRMKSLEQSKGVKLSIADTLDNIETALKSAFYMHFRHLYNNSERYSIAAEFQVAIFFFIRNFAYSGMFRYNSKGEFNVPYGGIGYNRKNIDKKIEYLKSEALFSLMSMSVVENCDFEEFLTRNRPSKDDFIFLDPPYDSEFSTYSKNSFTKEDQIRLADLLINKMEAKWMMIIKNTDFIYNLYNNKGLHIESFKKRYLVSFMNRNEQNVEHLLITNY